MQLTLPRGAADPFAPLRGLLDHLLMAITTAMSTTYKQQLPLAMHNHAVGGSAFNLALFDATATMDASTATYSGANEIANGNGYTTGGKALTNVAPLTSGTTAYWSFNTPIVWTGATFTARGAQIFNTSAGNASVGVFDFGANIPVVAGNFTVNFPTANATAAVLRIQ
jgi:hypothetical protein